MTRSDANTALSETFAYDAMNRLTSATVSLSPTPLVKTFAYDAIGRITSKSDVGTYTYPAVGQPRPHAVTSIAGGIINTTFTYDARGNMTAGNGLTVAYTSYDKPQSIGRGVNTVAFSHDTEHQRFKQVAVGGTTLYLASTGAMAELFAGIGIGGVTEWRNYLTVAGQIVGMKVTRSDSTSATRYFHKDHLGSISVITDETGAVVERLSYDAWGKRRFADGSDDPAGAIASQATRGFTEHEHLADVGLIHMNGRVYDPLLARFASADPMTESPFSTQGWNRYSYVGNSPLNFTDPSGYCFLGCFWKPIFAAISNALKSVPLLGNILQLAATVLICGPAAPLCAAVVATIASTAIAGITSGNLGTALRAGIITAFTAGAFFAAGELTGNFSGTQTPGNGHGVLQFGSDAHLFNIAAHATVGCAASVASGGRCGSGALSGAVGSFAGPLLKDLNTGAQLVATSVVGGLASMAGGGSFGNGAVTAAFGYLFNTEGMGHNKGPSMEDPPGTIRIPVPAWAVLIYELGVFTGAAYLDLITGPIPQDHHIFSRQFEGWFSQRDINIDDYTVTLDRTFHLQGVHGSGIGDIPGRWNSEWSNFIANNPNATRSEIFSQAGKMIDKYKLNNYDIHPYRK